MRIGEVMSVRLVSVGPEDPVSLAVARMNEEGVGSVTVCDGPELVGIFTERDLMRLAGEGAACARIRTSEVMTRRPVTVSPDDDIVSPARLMGGRRIRHLPVVQDGF